MSDASPAASSHAAADRLTHRPIVSAGVLIGVGLGAFVDGIVLHQILQVHNMLSARRPVVDLVSAEINMVWDGLFHAFAWVTTAIGITMLFRAGRRRDAAWSGRALFGATTIGWGLFNFVEGLIDHMLLEVHHVVERFGLSAWDWGFLVAAVVLMVAGTLIVRSAGPASAIGR